MNFVIPRESKCFYQPWLNEGGVREVADLPRSYPFEAMRANRVGTVVNGSKNDGPECVEAVE